MTKLSPDFVVCESEAAIVTHARVLDERHPLISYSGHVDRPRALCGSEVAWDTRSTWNLKGSVRCRDCLDALKKMGVAA